MDASKQIFGRKVEFMSKGKIMVVEDDVDLAEILTYNITMRGYRSVKALTASMPAEPLKPKYLTWFCSILCCPDWTVGKYANLFATTMKESSPKPPSSC